MIPLSTTANTVKKTLIWLSVVFIIILLVFLIVFRFKTTHERNVETPSEKIDPPVLASAAITTRQFNTQQLKLPQNIPESLMVYKSKENANFLDNANLLAQNLGFNEPPTETSDAIVGKKLFYDSKNIYLSIFANGFSYTNLSTELITAGQFADSTELASSAISFISKLGIQTNFSDDHTTGYFQNSGEFEKVVGNSQDANIIELNFNHKLSGLRVIGQNTEVFARFNKLDEMREVVFNQFNSGEKLTNYAIIEPEEALKQLIAGRGSLVNAIAPSDYSPIPKQLNSVSLQAAYLAYYKPSNPKQTIQPVWVFEGTSNVNNEDAFLIYAVPAIDPQYFKTPTSSP